jgi:hypothetical protein
MKQFLDWRVQVLLLLLCGGHQKVIDVVGGWYGASIEQQALGACAESSQGHVIGLWPHGSWLLLVSEPQPSYLSSLTDCALQQFGA